MSSVCAISGITEKIFVKEQSGGFDVFEAFANTDAVSPVKGSFKLEPFENFEKTNEALGTASLQSETKLNRGGTWSGQFYIKPRALGVAPDIGAILKAAFGVETITPATSVAYALSDTVCIPLQFMHVLDGHWSQFASGAWVEQLVITIPGNGLPMIEASGGFARFGWIYRGDIGGVVPTAGTQVPIDDDNIGNVRAPAMCEFTGDDNTGAGYVVTDNDDTPSSAHFDISPGIAGPGLSGGDEFLPFVLGQETGGEILSAVDCALTLGSLAPGFIEQTITVETGIGPKDKEATSEYATGVGHLTDRVVESDVSFYFSDTALGLSPVKGKAHEGALYDVDLRVGSDIAAKRLKVSMPSARLDITQDDLTELVTVSGKLVARQNAGAADELDLLFD